MYRSNLLHIVARMWRLYKTGIGLTTGFIGSHTVIHNCSVYTPTAHYSSLQHWPSLLTVSSLAACLPTPDSARTPRLTNARPEYSLFCILKTRSLQLTRQDCGVLTASARLYSMAGPLLGHVMFTARVRHIVYVASAIFFTSHSTVAQLPTASTSQYYLLSPKYYRFIYIRVIIM
jgi:hypothetical protein